MPDLNGEDAAPIRFGAQTTNTLRAFHMSSAPRQTVASSSSTNAELPGSSAGQARFWRDPKTYLGIFQAVATLAAAGWAAYLFFAFEYADRELARQISQLQVVRSQQEVSELTSPRLTPTHEIKVVDLGPSEGNSGERLYYVSYSYSFQNAGSRKNEVTYVIVHVYQGDPQLPTSGQVYHINDFATPGDLAWTPAFSKGHYYGPKWRSALKYADVHGKKVGFINGGGGTAELDAGEIATGSVDLYVSAKPSALIGFNVQIGLNDAKTSDERWHLNLWRPLRSDTTTSVKESNGESMRDGERQ